MGPDRRRGINRSGQIAGYGKFNGAWRAFLLTPTSDTIPPSSIAIPSPAPNASGWNNANVTVGLSATDHPGGSGVSLIKTSLSGAQTGTQVFSGSTASIMVTAEGVTTLTWSAVDAA